jgi:acid stress-induced BolA-like protein IbaG/YrbA
MGEQMFMTLRDQGDSSVITDALKQKVNRIIRENRHFTIIQVYEQCPDMSRTVVYEIVTEHLQYRKICARWVPRTSGSRRE